MTTTVNFRDLKERKLTAVDRTTADVVAGHYRYTDTAGRTYVLEAGPPPLLLEHHADCATSCEGDGVLTAGCVPDCPVRQLREQPSAAAAPLPSRVTALTDLADGAIGYAIGRLEAAFAELEPDTLGLVLLGGYPVRADAALDALRCMLATPWAERDRAARFAHGELEPGAVGAPPAALQMTLEQAYPITEPYLRTLRSAAAGPFERIDAAHWLLEHGFDAHPLLDLDLRAAARGELPQPVAPRGGEIA